MSQDTTAASSGDRVAVAPGWAMRLTGFLALFSGFALALLLIFSGALSQGLLVLLITLAGLPILSFLVYLIWRFYWYVLAALLSVFTLVALGGWLAIKQGVLRLPESWSAVQSFIRQGSLMNFLIALTAAAVVAATTYRFYTLLQMGELARLRRLLQGRKGSALFDFDSDQPSSLSAANVPLDQRVMRHLQETGHRGEQKGDLIHVFKKRDFVGIVRVVESAGAISPLIVRDVEKQRAKLGVKVAYLATAGWFTDEVRQMADQMGVKLITV